MTSTRLFTLAGRLLLGASLVALVPGCDKESPETLVRSAQDYQSKGEYKAAVIQLKNALQNAPDNGEARLLLGQALLETRDPASAERELRRALKLKQSDEVVAPALARALFETHEYDKLIQEFTDRRLKDPQGDAAIRTFVGEAHLVRGQPQLAAAAFAAALQVVPGFTAAQLGQARLAAVENRLDEAIRLAEGVIGVEPKTTDAYLLKAEVQNTQGRRAASKKTLEQAIEAGANPLGAHLALAMMLLDDGHLDQAGQQIEAARKVASGDLRVSYFDALLAFRNDDLNRARENVQKVLKLAPEHVPSLVLAGGVELRAGQLAAAEDHLRRGLARAPGNADARRLLVATLLRASQPGRALEALQPLIAGGVPTDPTIQMLAGETYLANGDVKQAAIHFQAASAGEGQSAPARTRLGQIAMAKGDFEGGIRELEAAAAMQSGNQQADLALIAGYERRGEAAKALAAARALTKKHPDDPLPYVVLGNLQVQQKDRSGARASLEKALSIAPTYVPAAHALAGLDLADTKPDAARSRFEAMQKQDPKNEQLLLAQADFEMRAGTDLQKVSTLVQKAVSANSQSSNARVALINMYLRNKDPRAALAAARDAAAVLPSDPRVIELLAVAQEANGEINQAVESFNKLAALPSGSAAPLQRLAGLHQRHKEHERAIEALLRAKKLEPNNTQIVHDLAALYTAAGKPEAALKLARELQARDRKHVGGYVLEGDVFASVGRFGEAERAYREALKIEPAANLLVAKLLTVLYRADKAKEAEAFAARWLADYPRDTVVRMFLADHAIRERKERVAADHYRSIIGVEPDNVIALNNLAYVAGAMGDPKAIDYAERAVKLAPENAAVLDTLGVLLVDRGEFARGLAHLSKARTIAPDRRNIQLNHARALAKAGQKDQARKALEALIALEQDVPEKAAAAELLKTL